MWKAIWWGFGGLVLGLVLGESLGAAQGAVLGTVIGSVLGALPAFGAWRRACKTPCRGCQVVCKTPQRSPVSGVMVAVAAATVAAVAARAVLGLTAPFLLPLEAAALGAAVSVRVVLLRLSPVLRRTGRLGLYSGPLAHKLAAQYAHPVRPPRMRAPRQKAITTGQAMIEAPTIEVTPDMVLGKAKEEAR